MAAAAGRQTSEEVEVKPMAEYKWREIRGMDDIYEIHHNPRGRAIIINNYEFDSGHLPGYSEDTDRLEELFQQLYFDVVIYENLKQKDMITTLKDESVTSEECDALILCILSRGDKGTVTGTDEKPITMAQLKDMFSASKAHQFLRGKPKLFIIQAFCGTEDESVEDGMVAASMDSKKLPDHNLADMCFTFSTVGGRVAWVDKGAGGSWFIQDVVHVFSQYANELHLHSLFQKVRKCTRKRIGNAHMALPKYHTTMDKDFYFFPKIENPWKQYKEKKNNFIMVVALEVGGKSGYAFSVRSHVTSIRMDKNLGDDYMCPGSLLLDRTGDLVAFGNVAESGDQEGCKFYTISELMSNKSGISEDSGVLLIARRKVTASDIFTMMMEYLKDQWRSQVTALNENFPTHKIRWVIPVPAEWDDKTKQCIRRAAVQAELVDTEDELEVVTKPEAAVAYFTFADKPSLKIQPGDHYLVVNAHEQTEITAHKVVTTGGHLQQLESSIAAGGNMVNENFTDLLRQILGGKYINELEKLHPGVWLQFLRRFEQQVHSKYNRQNEIKVLLSWTMGFKYNELEGKDIRDVIQKNGSPLGVYFSSEYLCLKPECMKKIIEPVLKDIMTSVEVSMRKLDKRGGVQNVVLVGDFAKSVCLQKELKSIYGNTIVSEDPQLSVLAGAVLHGHKY